MITIPFNVPYISPNAVASVAASLQSGKLAGDAGISTLKIGRDVE